MPYSTPRTWVAGDVLTAAQLNTDVRDNIAYLAALVNSPSCRVYHNTTQVLTNNVRAALAFNSERYDSDNMHDPATNNTRITINTAGVYVIGGQVEIPADTDLTIVDWSLRINGAAFIAFNTDNNPGVGAVPRNYQIHTLWKFAATDYVEFLVRQVNTSAGAATVIANASYSPDFYATRIGAG